MPDELEHLHPDAPSGSASMTMAPQKFVAVSRENHANKAWKSVTDFSFAAQQNLISIAANELMQTVPVLPLGFAELSGVLTLVGITSPEPGQNYFVDSTGKWLGAYLPIALRSYPFRMVKPEDQDNPILCVLEDSALVVETGQGEAFFTADGSPSDAIQAMLKLLSDSANSSQRTRAAVLALSAAGLMQPWPLKLQRGDTALEVNGLFRINEAALNQLDATTLQALRDQGALNIAYAQMFSMGQMQVLSRLGARHTQWVSKVAAPLPAELALDFLNQGGTISFAGLGG